MDIVQPEGWPRPKGFSNGIIAEGRWLAIAGQIGWNKESQLVSVEFAGQAAQAMRNVAAVLRAAGGEPKHLVRMTWYVTDKRAYIAALQNVGAAYKEILGTHYPAMTLVQVADLLEDGALVEIEATAVLP
jgi:enamine deaminase RidA (YjgF/YER057c/UK114 family)